jgi:hypothetical protein
MTWRKLWLYSFKNAVNALIVNSGMWLIDPHDFNLHDWAGIIKMAKMALAVIGSREVTVWLPHLLKWSSVAPGDEPEV